MKKIVTYFAAIFLICWIVARHSPQQAPACVHFERRDQLLPVPLSLYVLYVRPDEKCQIDLEMGHNRGLGLQTVKAMAERRKAVAAINGGFFMEGKFEGAPVHIFKKGSQWLSDPFHNRGAIGWADGGKKAIVGRLGMKWELEIAGVRFPISRVNKPRNYRNAILYTSALYDSTLNSARGTEIIISNGQVVEVKKNVSNAPIPPDGFIYSVGAESGIDTSFIRLGDLVTLRYEFISHDINSNNTIENTEWGNMEYILGGTPVLIADGKIAKNFYIDETAREFIDVPHARTAVGLLADGTWVMAVVDGGNPFHSFGMTIPQLADFMYSLGAVTALNLDGGGSSTLYFKGTVRNYPVSPRIKGEPDSGPPVGDAIVVLDQLRGPINK